MKPQCRRCDMHRRALFPARMPDRDGPLCDEDQECKEDLYTYAYCFRLALKTCLVPAICGPCRQQRNSLNRHNRPWIFFKLVRCGLIRDSLKSARRHERRTGWCARGCGFRCCIGTVPALLLAPGCGRTFVPVAYSTARAAPREFLRALFVASPAAVAAIPGSARSRRARMSRVSTGACSGGPAAWSARPERQLRARSCRSRG